MADERFQVLITATGETYPCTGEQTLLNAMARMGRKGIPSGCHGGGCGVCKIRIVSGEVVTGVMSRSQVTEAEEREGFALACRCYPRSDITLDVVGKIRKAVSRPLYGANQLSGRDQRPAKR